MRLFLALDSEYLAILEPRLEQNHLRDQAKGTLVHLYKSVPIDKEGEHYQYQMNRRQSPL